MRSQRARSIRGTPLVMYIKGGSQMYKIHFLYSVHENFNNRNNASMIYAFLWLKCAYTSSFCLYISLAYLTSMRSMHL